MKQKRRIGFKIVRKIKPGENYKMIYLNYLAATQFKYTKWLRWVATGYLYSHWTMQLWTARYRYHSRLGSKTSLIWALQFCLVAYTCSRRRGTTRWYTKHSSSICHATFSSQLLVLRSTAQSTRYQCIAVTATIRFITTQMTLVV